MVRRPEVKQENTARKLSPAEPDGIHLCYSSQWTLERRRNEVARLTSRDTEMAQRARRVRGAEPEKRSVARFGMAAAAISGPVVWLGYALLQWKHLL